MTMTIPAGGLRSARQPRLLDAVRAAWSAHRRHRAQLDALRYVGRLGPRLMEDMGVDPEVIRAAADPWDRLPLNGFLMQRW